MAKSERLTPSSPASLAATWYLGIETQLMNRFVFFFFPFSSTEFDASCRAKVVLYICSRVMASFIPRATPKREGSTAGVRPVPPDSRYFSVFAALVWGCVMWLFEHKGETIQPGMFNSMTYLYRDSNVWADFRTLLWHNR